MRKPMIKILGLAAILIALIYGIPSVKAEKETETFPVLEDSGKEDWSNFLEHSNVFPDEQSQGMMPLSVLTKDYRVARITCENEYGYAYVTFLRLDGEPVFCLDPLATIRWDADYVQTTAWNDLAVWQQEAIWKYAYYGYAYPGHQNDRYYLASQLLIWEVVDRWYDPYTTDNSAFYDVSAELNEIKWLAEHAGQAPSFAGQTIDLALDLPIVLSDAHQVLSNYHVENVKGIELTASKNQLTLKLTDGAAYARSATFHSKTNTNAGTPIVYKASGSQTVMKVTPYQSLKPFTLSFNWGSGNIKILKKNEEGAGIAGAVFEVAQDASMETVLGTTTTGIDGSFELQGIQAGKVYIREIAVPTSYRLDPTIRTVEVYPQKTAVLEITNEYIQGQVQLIKKDRESGQVLAGAVYGLYNEKHEVLQKMTVQADGTALSKPIRYGCYYLKEERAPAGYVIDPTEHWFKIENQGEVVEMELTDQPQKGRIQITKLDSETGEKPQGDGLLSDVTYQIFAEEKIVGAEGTVHYEKGALVETLEASSSIVSSSLLPLGTYRICEAIPSTGYNLNTACKIVPLSSQDQTTEAILEKINYENTVIKGSFEITKYVDEKISGLDWMLKSSQAIQIPAEGFIFDVYLKRTGELVDTLITDENGHASSKSLPYGWYRLKERPAEGYQPMEEIEIQIQEQGKVLHFILENSVIRSELTLFKVDSQTGKVIPAAGVSFKLKDGKGNVVTQTVTYPTKTEIDTFVTDQNGMVHFPEPLLYGKYTLCELTAPHGYVLSQEEIEITVDGSVKELLLNVENDPVKGRIALEKTGEVLEGYVEQETEFGTMYVPQYGIKPLAGVQYQVIAREEIVGEEGTVHYQKGEIVDTLITSDEGKAISKKLPLGAYTLKEIETPLGYVLDPECHDFDLIYQDQTTPIVLQTWNLFNQRQTVTLNLKKELEGEPLDPELYEQIRFGIFTAEPTILPQNSLVAVLSLNQAGMIENSLDLAEGKYVLKELQTAEGYQLNPVELEFTVRYQDPESSVLSVDLTENGTFVNALRRLQVEIIKVSEQNHEKLLDGAVFEIYDHTAQISLGRFTSGQDGPGRILIQDIAYGTQLEIREVTAPAGYQKALSPWNIVVNGKEEVMTLILENKKIELPEMGEKR